MIFSQKREINKNYNFLSGFSWHVPGITGNLAVLGWMAVGMIITMIITTLLTITFQNIGISGLPNFESYLLLVMYPMQFAPAMIASLYISNRNRNFDTGYKLDSNNFGKLNLPILSLICILSVLSLSFINDGLNSFLPEMPETLKEAMKKMTSGNIILNFIMVSIFAPFFEEWLCRGIVLRGLLNHRNKNGNNVSPAIAIVISAIFFALIHLNIWQAIPAFIVGCFMGFVYYRTGSLKLTMLIHFINNTTSLIISRIDGLKDADSWTDVMSQSTFAVLVAISVIILAISILLIHRNIKPLTEKGSCDEIPASDF